MDCAVSLWIRRSKSSSRFLKRYQKELEELEELTLGAGPVLAPEAEDKRKGEEGQEECEEGEKDRERHRDEAVKKSLSGFAAVRLLFPLNIVTVVIQMVSVSSSMLSTMTLRRRTEKAGRGGEVV